MFKLDLEKAEEPHLLDHEKHKKFPEKNIYFCLIDYANTLTVWITINREKILKGMEIPDLLTNSWEICMQVKKQQLELGMEQQTGSK